MNYFAHGRRFVHDPYFLAGTAIPDWLNVVNRKARARSRLAKPFVNHENEVVAAVAGGIVQHHYDDDWFHQTRAFAELSLEFTVEIRDRLPRDDGFRPSFLGHILVELLLDSELIDERPELLDEYYAAVGELDADIVTDVVNRMVTRPVPTLALLLPRFCSERFLSDYADDHKLLWRLNHVMRRVKLPALPDSLATFFPKARQKVRKRKDELLAGE